MKAGGSAEGTASGAGGARMKKAQSSLRDARTRKKDSGDVVDLSILHEGCYFLKFGRKGVAHERLIRLTPDNRYVEWETSFFSFKPKDDCRVDLESVSRIQHGQMTANFERQKEQFGSAHGNSFSLIYNNDRSLDLIAPSPEVFRLWFLGLRQILTDIKTEKMNTSSDKRYLKAKWDVADADGNGSLSKSEVVDLIMSMNINRPKSIIHAMYKRFDADNSGSLSFKEFCNLMDVLRQRDDLLFLWSTINNIHDPDDLLDISTDPTELKARFGGKPILTVNDTIPVSTFLDFWLSNQKQNLSFDKAVKVIAANMDTEFNKKNPVLSYVGFCSIMSSSFNDGFVEKKQKLYQDMQLPLSYYYMASSHNTYLEGDQLTSASSVNRYIDDLCKGCRCVELDCWDGDDGEPIIFHGHTLTTKILFRDVINSMAEFNFRVSPYPVVLSIENHCSLPQQELMAEIMKVGFGDTLLMPGELMGDGSHLPTLTQLKYKVLVKGKRLKSGEGLDDDDDSGDDSGDDDADDDDDVVAKAKQSRKKAPTLKVHPSLSSIVFLGTCHCTSFDKSNSDSIPPDMMTSYGEAKTIKYVKNESIRQGWIYHNINHLSRIYPKGTRVDSSNLDPTPAWAAGNQLVALNYQTPCVQMQLNHGKFRENGECGYVLKPEYMYKTSANPSPPTVLKIHIISAQQLPKPGGAKKGEVIDPYVSLALYAASTKEPVYQHTTVVENNGFNPVWDEIFEFDVAEPDVSHLYMKVMDSDLNQDDFIAFTSTPVSSLASGYRTFKLFDEKGNREGDFYFASLFARVTFA